MPRYPKAAARFASLNISDSEPDFDDVETIEALPPRRNDQKSLGSKGSQNRQGGSANHATKLAQCNERSHNDRKNNPSLSATTGDISVEDKTKNRSLTSLAKSNYVSLQQPASHDSDSMIIGDGQSQLNSKRSHKTKDKLDDKAQPPQKMDMGKEIANGRNIQATLVDQNPDATGNSTKIQEKVRSRDEEVSQVRSVYDEGERLASKKSSELREKYLALEARHIELREVGVKAAECNFERLKKQSMETAEASSILIRELKEELAVQSALIKHNEQIGRQLERTKTNMGDLERTVADLTASLSKAKSEIRSLSAKLAASRAVEAGAKVSASMTKTATGVTKSTSSEALLAAQAKEDLYADLTGLIVRGTTELESGNVFDCIQTGRNGTLHFKLASEAGEDPEKYDEVQLTYKPQLDEERDRDLISIMPDYLVEEITFTRTQASNFYSKINKCLTERQS